MLNKLLSLFVKIAFGAIFLLAITPVGVLFRVFGIDLLQKKIDRQALSYWKDHA